LASERATDGDRDSMQAMVTRLGSGPFDLRGYAETVRGTHDLIVAGAHNAYLADAMAPLQGLSRRFWITHVVDAEAEIKTGADLHVAILRSIVDANPDAAEAASIELNDYLVDFTLATLRPVPRQRT
jgi:DNA-binding GntR family transcriptional regulator